MHHHLRLHLRRLYAGVIRLHRLPLGMAAARQQQAQRKPRQPVFFHGFALLFIHYKLKGSPYPDFIVCRKNHGGVCAHTGFAIRFFGEEIMDSHGRFAPSE